MQHFILQNIIKWYHCVIFNLWFSIFFLGWGVGGGGCFEHVSEHFLIYYLLTEEIFYERTHRGIENPNLRLRCFTVFWIRLWSRNRYLNNSSISICTKIHFHAIDRSVTFTWSPWKLPRLKQGCIHVQLHAVKRFSCRSSIIDVW